MKISIITVNFNDKVGLEQTLQSETALRTSDALQKEIIIIDGGSTDESAEVIKKYENAISYWCSERDRGIYHAMNKGVEKASGDYCIFMNSGDTFASDDVLTNVFADGARLPEFSDVITGATYYCNPETKTEELGFPPKKVSLGFFYNKTLQHQSSFIKTSLLRKFPYDESLKIAGDIKFWIQCLILNGSSYASSDIPVAKFNLLGVLSRPEDAEYNELRRIFSDLKMNRIIFDYDLIMKPQNLKMRICRHFFTRALKKDLGI